MSDRATEERIAQLQARAQAQRLAAQLAILEAREQLAPLRSAYGFAKSTARLLSPGGAPAGLLGSAARFGIGHPWLTSAVATAALRMMRRHPVAAVLAAATGALTWWILRAPPARTPADESAE